MRKIYKIAILGMLLLMAVSCERQQKVSKEPSPQTEMRSLRQYEKLLSPDTPVVIRIWHYYNSAQKKNFDDLVARFNATVGKEKGIVVESFSQGDLGEMTEALLNALNKEVGADEVPDLATSYADTAWKFTQRDALASIDKYFTEEELADYLQPYIREGYMSTESSLKIFPIAKSTEIMVLNRTDWEEFAKENGFTYENLSTFEGLAEVAERYYHWTDLKTSKANDGRAFFGRDVTANYFLAGMHELGKDLIYYENGKVKLSADKNVIRTLWENYFLPYVFGYFDSELRFRSDDLRSGKILCCISSTSGTSYLKPEVVDDDGNSRKVEYELLPVPHFQKGVKKTAIQQGAGMILLRSDERKEYAAAVFLKWLTEPEQNIVFAVNTGYLPVKWESCTKDMIRKVMKDEQPFEGSALKESLKIGIDTVLNNELYSMPPFEKAFEVRRTVGNMLEQKAKEAREEFRETLQRTSFERAKQQFSQDRYFEQWYAELVRELEKLVE